MSKRVKVKNPDTGKDEVHSVQNASDLCQHLGWTRVGIVLVKDGVEVLTPQEVINRARDAAKKAEAKEADDEGEAEEPIDEMTEAEIAALNKEAKA